MGPGPHLRFLADSGHVDDLARRRRTRYLSLIGGACGSVHDWFATCRPASPQTWGEQTDVPGAADWYNSTYLIITGANLPMTRTRTPTSPPKCAEAPRSSMAPDYAEYVKFADLWMPVKRGTDAAAFMAMGHVALNEFRQSRIRTSEYAQIHRPADAGDAAQVRRRLRHRPPTCALPTSTATSAKPTTPSGRPSFDKKTGASSRPTAPSASAGARTASGT